MSEVVTPTKDRAAGWNPGMLLFALAFAVFMGWVCSGYGTGRVTLSEMLQGPAFFGLISGVIMLVASCRVRVRNRAVELVNVISIRTVPFADIKAVEAENGLQLLTNDGAELGSVAFGASLLAAMTGNRRASRLRSRLLEAMAKAGEPGPEVESDIRFRPGVALIPVAMSLGALVYTLALRAMSVG